MSFSLKFRFVLAVLMLATLLALSPWFSHRPIAATPCAGVEIASIAAREAGVADLARATLASYLADRGNALDRGRR